MLNFNRVVIFSGAGISAESGISTFRATNGLWENYKIEEVATPQAWARDPDMVQEFYNLRRRNIRDAQPNNAHRLIAKLEENYEVTVVTQNIDDLHERAGSSNVLHLHGNIMQVKSSGPNAEQKYYDWKEDLDVERNVCPEGYALRPHVVWFGEDVPNYEHAREIIQSAEVFIVIGTSLNVYPAAGLIDFVSEKCKCYLIDPSGNHLHVPKNYTILEMGAIQGMEILCEQLGK